MRRQAFLITLIFFALSAGMGLWIRLAPWVELPWEYRNMIHAHSHVALLGWAFNILLLALIERFLGPAWLRRGYRRKVFWSMQILVGLMLIFFAREGYAAVSITASSLHIVGSYWLILAMARNAGAFQRAETPQMLLFQNALIALALSSLGPWALAVISAQGGAGTPLYDSAIYWYLHFSYNGWLTLGWLAVAMHWAMPRIKSWSALQQRGLVLFIATTYASYLLSLLEFDLGTAWVSGASAIGLLHLISWFMMIYPLWPLRHQMPQSIRGWTVAAGAIVSLKIAAQFFSTMPGIMEWAFHQRDIIIAYIHWTFLGWISLASLIYMFRNYPKRVPILAGFSLFFLGFITQEIVLGMRALGHHDMANEGLALASSMMLAGIIYLLFNVRHIPKLRAHHEPQS